MDGEAVPVRAPLRDRVLGHPVDAVDVAATVRILLDRCRAGRTAHGADYVCLSNVHTTMESQHLPLLRSAADGALLSVADGMPLAWILRRRGHQAARKVRGADLMRTMAADGREAGVRHLLYGGAPGTAEAAAAELRRLAPGVSIVGTIAPPYSTTGDWAPDDLREVISAGRPDIIWVGLGAPKQEIWMARVAGELDVPLLIGVGAAFDFVAGSKPEAPRLLIRLGLEWLFRLMSEPRRLWRRYLFGNISFLLMLARYRAPGEPHRESAVTPDAEVSRQGIVP